MIKKYMSVPVALGAVLLLGGCIPFGKPEPPSVAVSLEGENGSAISLDAKYKGVKNNEHTFVMEFKNEGKSNEKLLSRSGSFVSIVVKDGETGKVVYDTDKSMMGITAIQVKNVEPNEKFILEAGIERGRIDAGTDTVELSLDKSEKETLDVTLEDVKLD